ncbi:MAG: thiamine pyrophosphate-binding protein [Haloferacaceae archaeon]
MTRLIEQSRRSGARRPRRVPTPRPLRGAEGTSYKGSVPERGRIMRGYEAVNRLLFAAGVETVFQYMAEDTMELVADLETTWGDAIEAVHARHEQGAMAMADGYARSGDRIGVCVVGRGPGIAQTGTALCNARKNGTPLLVVVPTPARDDRHDPKEFDQAALLRATAGEVVTVGSPDTLVPIFREAIRRVHVGECPLAVQIPTDVLEGSVAVPPDVADVSPPEGPDANAGGSGGRGTPRPPATSRPSAGRLEPDPDLIDEAVDLFRAADASRPPVVLVGRGAVAADAREAIEAVAERMGAVVVTSLLGRDYFEDHPFAAGFSGNWGSPLANEITSEADYVLAVGCSLNDHTVDEGRLVDDATVVHVDADPASIGRYTDVDLGIVGDARITVDALAQALDREGVHRADALWTDRLRDRIASYSPLDGPDYPEKPGRMDPRALTRKLEDVLPDARLVGADGGQFRKWALHELTAPPSDSIVSCDFAAIGLGLPLGIGIGQYLRDENRSNGDDRTAITLCGDGGFMMSLQEVETAVRHEVPVVVIVGNDSSLSAEYHNLAARGGPADVARLSTPPIAEVATALGADGHTARRLEDVDAIAGRLQDPDGPVVVECIVDHEVRHHSY